MLKIILNSLYLISCRKKHPNFAIVNNRKPFHFRINCRLQLINKTVHSVLRHIIGNIIVVLGIGAMIWVFYCTTGVWHRILVWFSEWRDGRLFGWVLRVFWSDLWLIVEYLFGLFVFLGVVVIIAILVVIINIGAITAAI